MGKPISEQNFNRKRLMVQGLFLKWVSNVVISAEVFQKVLKGGFFTQFFFSLCLQYFPGYFPGTLMQASQLAGIFAQSLILPSFAWLFVSVLFSPEHIFGSSPVSLVSSKNVIPSLVQGLECWTYTLLIYLVQKVLQQYLFDFSANASFKKFLHFSSPVLINCAKYSSWTFSRCVNWFHPRWWSFCIIITSPPSSSSNLCNSLQIRFWTLCWRLSSTAGRVDACNRFETAQSHKRRRISKRFTLLKM